MTKDSLKKTLLRFALVIGFLIFFALLQSSFLFYPFYFVLSFVFFALFVFLYNLFENPQSMEGVFFAGFAGFLVDVFSQGPIGIYLLIFFLFSYLIKVLLKKYVGIPSFS